MKTQTHPILRHALLALAACLAIHPVHTHATGLIAFDSVGSDGFGGSVSRSRDIGLVGAQGNDLKFKPDEQGSAYVFRNLDTATGTVTQNAKLTAVNGAAYDFFGASVSLAGRIGLIGAYGVDVGSAKNQGTAYIFRNLDTATGRVFPNLNLIASDGAERDQFGVSVSLYGRNGLVGANADDVGANRDQGSAYFFRDLNTGIGTVIEKAKLIASDGTTNDLFGTALSLSGSIGLVGAFQADIGGNRKQGSAYVFRNLDTATGTVFQKVKLTASDGRKNDRFGIAVSLFGSIGLVGATGDNFGVANYNQGSAYVFRNLDTASGTVTENVKLTASDGFTNNRFGYSVSVFSSVGLVGTLYQNTVYLYRNLSTASGTVTENVRLTASDAADFDSFGQSVNLSDDDFIIGAPGKNFSSGKAYSGSVKSVTTLNDNNSSKIISGISFASQDDWIVGRSTDSNEVTLRAGDTANVTAGGKAVYIGQEAGSDANVLTIAGNLVTSQVYIGSTGGNRNNALYLTSTATVSLANFRLAARNLLLLEGDYTNIANLLAELGAGTLQTWSSGAWVSVTESNYTTSISMSFDALTGYTTIEAIPAP